MRGRAFLASIMASVILLGSAAADTGSDIDPPTTDGPLDLVGVSHGHNPSGDYLVHKITTKSFWSSNTLQSDGQASRHIRVPFDVDKGRGYDGYAGVTERTVLISFRNGELRAKLYNNLGDPPKHLANLRVWRPNQRTVAFRIRPRQLKRNLDHYWWGVESYYSSGDSFECPPDDACFDRAPNKKEGYLRHDL